MEQIYIPPGYQRVMPYLIVKDANKFIAFAKTVFDATEKMMHRRPEGDIMHAELFIGDSVIMFADCSNQWEPMPAGLYVHVANADETYRKALAAGAASVMEPSDQSYGRSGGVLDPCGNTWWIVTTEKN